MQDTAQYLAHFLSVAEKNKHLFAALMNIVLVKEGGRTATLVETANFAENAHAFWNIVKDFVAYNKLEYHYDRNSVSHAPRYFVYRNGAFPYVPDRSDTEIGRALEMYCAGSDYSNYKAKRTTARITEVKTQADVFTEVCLKSTLQNPQELRRSTQRKVNHWNRIVANLGLPYNFSYELQEDVGTGVRLHHMVLGNLPYMNRHKADYLNEFDNVFDEDLGISDTFEHAIASTTAWTKHRKFLISVFFVGCYAQFFMNVMTSRETKKVVEKLRHDNDLTPKEICNLITHDVRTAEKVKDELCMGLELVFA
jgi:hypothetical protein